MPSSSDPRTRLTVALLGTAFAVFVAAQAPALVPALTLGVAVWVALYAFLRL